VKPICASVAAILLSLASGASADRILVVEDDQTRRVGARLRAELESLGFETQVADTSEEPTRASLEEAARQAGAMAALRVRASRAGVEVWIQDRVTSKTVLREVVVAEGQDESVVAVRAVELLRASLLEVGAPGFAGGELPPTPTVERLVEPPAPPERRLSLALGPALGLSPGGLGPTPHVDVAVRWRAAGRFVLGTRVFVPALPAAVDGPEGRASVSLSAASITGDAELLPPGRFFARAGVGVGALWAHMDGAAAPSFVGRGDDVFAALSFVHAGAAVAASRDVRFFGDATLAVATPRPVVRFADREVASWGRPAAFFTLGLEVGVF
jgi:hypothetical protein